MREWRLKNKDANKIRKHKYYVAHKSQIIERERNWRLKNKEKSRKHSRSYYRKNRCSLKYILSKRISHRIRESFFNIKRGRHWESILGYTVQDLKHHIESLFTTGMTWDLLLKGKIHIDHKIPISFFHYTKVDDPEFQYCWSLNNLQPLWDKDNMSKHDRIEKQDGIAAVTKRKGG